MDTIQRSSASPALNPPAAVLDVADRRDQELGVAPSSAAALAHMARSEAGRVSPRGEQNARSLPSPGAFFTSRIDDNPRLLTDSYRLRYQVYCVEREFLNPENYPDRLEVDEFDRYAWHFGTMDSTGRLVATARLVFPSIFGLPLFRRCSIYRVEAALCVPQQRIAGESRFTMCRTALNSELFAGLSGSSALVVLWKAVRDLFKYSFCRGVYQESKRGGL